MKTEILLHHLREYTDMQPAFDKNDYVKLIFEQKKPRGAERMWVQVAEKIGHQYIGTLSNQPVTIRMKLGDMVVFESIHVLDTMTQQQCMAGTKQAVKRAKNDPAL